MCISSRNLWLEHGKGFKRAFLHILTQLCHTKRSLHNTRRLISFALIFLQLYKICNLSSALFQLLLLSLSLPSSFRPCHGCLTVLYPVFPCHCSHCPLESVASRVISAHSNLYGDLSAPWIILEIWKCPQDVSEFSCYRNPRDLQDSDYIGKSWTVRAVQNRICGNDEW